MHKHQPSISSTRTNDEGLDGAVPPASVFLFVAHPIIASTTATPTPPTHSLTRTLSLTLTLSLTPTPTPTPTPHIHAHLVCIVCSLHPHPQPSVSCDVVGDSHRRSFCGPGRPPNHLSYTHLLSPQPSGTAHHLSPSNVTPVLHVATYYCFYYYYHDHYDHHQPPPPPPPTPALLLTTLSFQIPTRLGVGGQARQPPCYRCYCCHCCCWLLRAIHVALPIVSYHDCTDR